MNPFGRVLVGQTRPLLAPSEIELVRDLLVFGTDGVLGKIRGVRSEFDLAEVAELLIEPVRGRTRGLLAIPIHLLDDWETLDLCVSSRQLRSFAEGRQSGQNRDERAATAPHGAPLA